MYNKSDWHSGWHHRWHGHRRHQRSAAWLPLIIFVGLGLVFAGPILHLVAFVFHVAWVLLPFVLIGGLVMMAARRWGGGPGTNRGEWHGRRGGWWADRPTRGLDAEIELEKGKRGGEGDGQIFYV